MMNRPQYALVALVTSMVITAGVAIQFSAYNTRTSEQKWCTLVTELDKTYQAVPPTTTTGQSVASAIHNLTREFHCQE